jgi:hypothetical protein
MQTVATNFVRIFQQVPILYLLEIKECFCVHSVLYPVPKNQ